MAKKQRVNRKIERQQRLASSRHNIAKQSAAVLALGLGLTAVGPAEASIVYVPVHQTITSGSLDFLNVFGDYQFTAGLDPGVGAQVYPLGWDPYVGSPNYVFLNKSYLPQYFGARLLKGDPIPVPNPGPPANYANYGYLVYGLQGDWKDGNPGYLGLLFSDGTDAFYGWAQLSVATDLSSLTLIDYAYENVKETPIEAGAVPLPGSLALMATGAAGLLAYRRMKRAA